MNLSPTADKWVHRIVVGVVACIALGIAFDAGRRSVSTPKQNPIPLSGSPFQGRWTAVSVNGRPYMGTADLFVSPDGSYVSNSLSGADHSEGTGLIYNDGRDGGGFGRYTRTDTGLRYVSYPIAGQPSTTCDYVSK
jgi:hypothetical protein